jgi:enoyl-CoA hydratase/carnithine racemase
LARRLLLTGELLPASDFGHTGWIQSIVPETDLDAAAMRLADLLAGRHSPAQRQLKTLLHRIEGLTPEVALRAELATFADNWTMSSVADALTAFLDTRPVRATKAETA